MSETTIAPCDRCKQRETGTSNFSPTEIAVARAQGRMRVEPDGLGFVVPSRCDAPAALCAYGGSKR